MKLIALVATPEWFKQFDHFMYYRASLVFLGLFAAGLAYAIYCIFWKDVP